MTVRRDLKVAAGLALICTTVALAVPIEAFRVIAALPLTLVLPGYAVSVAAFAPWGLSGPRLLLLSLALSLSVLAVGALPLNYVPGGITRGSWAVLLLVVVLAGCVIAALRNPAPAGAPADGWLPRLRLRIGIAGAALLLGAVIAVGAAFVLARTPLAAKNAIGYTRLWMLPAPRTHPSSVRIGVRSQEQQAHSYRLEVRLGSHTRPVASRSFVLEPGHGRGVQVTLRRPRRARFARVTALLFEREHPDRVYRRVTGWIAGA